MSCKTLVPTYALVANVDLVVIRRKDEEQASVLYGRCLHRGALLSDGHIGDHWFLDEMTVSNIIGSGTAVRGNRR